MDMTRRYGTVRQLPSGRWQAHVPNPYGGRPIKAPQTFTSAEEADTWTAAQRVAVAGGTFVDPALGGMVLRDWAARWQASRTNATRPTTDQRDDEYLDRYVLPTFGATPIGAIQPLAVRDWLVSLMDDRGLAHATAAKAGQILSKVLDLAVEDRRIAMNPCRGVKLPKAPDPEEMTVLDAQQAKALAAAMDQRYRSLVLLGCFGGLRIGEMVALRVSDVDVKARTVSVSRSYVDYGGQQLHLHAPKTQAGRRKVPVPTFVADALADTMKGKAPADLLWTAPNGRGPLRLTNWRNRYWRKATAAIGVPQLRIHDMRHTAITLWVAGGVDIPQAGQWAGHASLASTYRYAHARRGQRHAALDELDAQYRAAG